MTQEVAEDVLEAVERAGGKAHIYGPMAGGAFGVSIAKLPDVARFTRALAHVGVAGRLVYSAATGFKVVGLGERE